MTAKKAPSEFLSSDDILSEDACHRLVLYGEENDLIDYKVSFNQSLEKTWIDLAIDCVSFANSLGGYVVFGVRNNTWEQVGLTQVACSALSDTKKVLEQINIGLVPPITHLRTRIIVRDEKTFAVVAVPCSSDRTHIFENNRDWKTPGGDIKTLVQKGAIYVRRSASNQVLTSADFEQLIERRFQRQRDKILEGIARVVNAPTSHDVVTVVKADDGESRGTYLVSDAPGSSDMRGQRMQFAADNVVSVIEAFRSISENQPGAVFDAKFLLSAYAERDSAGFRENQIEWLALQSLLLGAPAFFWLEKLKKARARKLIEEAFGAAGWRKGAIVAHAGFYGKPLHQHLRDRMTGPGKPHAYRSKQALMNVSRSNEPEKDAARATELARTLAKGNDATMARQLERLDCAVYAPFSGDD